MRTKGQILSVFFYLPDVFFFSIGPTSSNAQGIQILWGRVGQPDGLEAGAQADDICSAWD